MHLLSLKNTGKFIDLGIVKVQEKEKKQKLQPAGLILFSIEYTNIVKHSDNVPQPKSPCP